jgi:twitching motility protein PilT
MSYSMSDLLQLVVAEGASDLHIRVGTPPVIRVHGILHRVEGPALKSEDSEELMRSITSEEHIQSTRERGGADFGFAFGDAARFRVSVFKAKGDFGLVLRQIPSKLLTMEQIGIPPSVKELLYKPRGLILVTGPTGSGKTTTLASMLNIINEEREEAHIITIEDPIEYYHKHKKSLVTQREIGVDVPNFAEGLRRALRQDPDIVLVGEMRDLETISTALLAAETGHLVFSTLHTLDATETIQRIIAVFPPPEQKQIRLQLASTLRAVVSQRLVRKSDGVGRVPAVEVLISTGYIRDCIINADKTRMIRDALAAGTSQYGMQTFDQSIFDLYSKNLITLDEALIRASNPDEFKLRIQGIRSSADAAREEMERTMTEFERTGPRR